MEAPLRVQCRDMANLEKTQRRTKSTRKRNTPENAGNRPFPESAFSGVLRFRVCFWRPLRAETKSTPKTQHTRKRRFWKRSVTCVFGCVAFSGAFWRLPNLNSDFLPRPAPPPPKRPRSCCGVLWDQELIFLRKLQQNLRSHFEFFYNAVDFSGITICPTIIALQHLIFRQLVLGAVMYSR